MYKFVHIFWVLHVSHRKYSPDLELLIIHVLVMQVYTGPRKTNHVVDADLSTLNVDDLVAVFCENYAREPVIGRCTQIFDETIEVLWMDGSYKSLWKPWKVRDAKNRRKVIDWVDRIPKMSILLFGFTLTMKTIERLKEEYIKIKQMQSPSTDTLQL